MILKLTKFLILRHGFFEYIEKYHNNILTSIAEKKVIEPAVEKELISAIENFKREFRG